MVYAFVAIKVKWKDRESEGERSGLNVTLHHTVIDADPGLLKHDKNFFCKEKKNLFYLTQQQPPLRDFINIHVPLSIPRVVLITKPLYIHGRMDGC